MSEAFLTTYSILAAVFVVSIFMIIVSFFVYDSKTDSPSYGQMVIAIVFSYIYALSFPLITYSYWKKIKSSGLFFIKNKVVFNMINIKKEFSYDFSIKVENKKQVDIVIKDEDQSAVLHAEWVGCYTLDEAKKYVNKIEKTRDSIREGKRDEC